MKVRQTDNNNHIFRSCIASKKAEEATKIAAKYS